LGKVENETRKLVSMMKEPAQFVSTLPKPRKPTLNPKLCQRASKADPICPQGIGIADAQKNKINLCFVDSLVRIERMIILELNN